MNCQRVFVLRALNQKDHQESNDRRSRIDHELPRVGKLEDWSSDAPDHNYCHRKNKGERCPCGFSGLM